MVNGDPTMVRIRTEIRAWEKRYNRRIDKAGLEEAVRAHRRAQQKPKGLTVLPQEIREIHASFRNVAKPSESPPCSGLRSKASSVERLRHWNGLSCYPQGTSWRSLRPLKEYGGHGI